MGYKLKPCLNSDELFTYLFLKQPSEFFSKDTYKEIIGSKITINASAKIFLTYLSANKLKFQVPNTFKKAFFPT